MGFGQMQLDDSFKNGPSSNLLQFPQIFDEVTPENVETAKKDQYENFMGTAVSLFFESNSNLVSAFYDAIEMTIIK